MNEYYFCVDSNYPKMTVNRSYNAPTLPRINIYGENLYDIKHALDSLDPTDTSLIRVSIPEGAKAKKTDFGYASDMYIYKETIPLDESYVKRLIESGTNYYIKPNDSGLIDWCVYNDHCSLLSYLIDRDAYMLKTLGEYVYKMIGFSKYNNLIKRLVLTNTIDISMDNDSILLFAASRKDVALCKFLLDNGANIPPQVKIMFNANRGMFPDMDELILNYKGEIAG